MRTFVNMFSLESLSEVELIIFDFDGVFTDNTVYISQDNRESVRCWRSDGLGLQKLRDIGVKLHIVSSEVNSIVTLRAQKINVDCLQGVINKAKAVEAICAKYSIQERNAMFVGNDINDISALEIVGFPVGVADSYEEIYPYILYRTKRAGGMGAVRELCDAVFDAKKKLTKSEISKISI